MLLKYTRVFISLYCLLFFSCFFFLLPQLAGAQNYQQKIQISAFPATPQPGQQVTLTAESFVASLRKAPIIWTVNGVQVDKGVGKTSIRITAGALGTSQTVRVSAETSEQGVVTDQLTLSPAAVALIWEGDTYTPPLYKGRSLYSPQSTVRVAAVPQIMKAGKILPPKGLVYTWKKDGKVIPEASGYGKDSYSFSAGFLTRPIRIDVEVAPTDQSVVARNNSTLTPRVPLVLVYEQDPALGLVRENSLETSYSLKNKEITLAAIPYFFTARSTDDPFLTYNWRMNGQSIPGNSNHPSFITLRQDGAVSGQGIISLEIAHKNYVLQDNTTSFSIYFGDNSSPLSL